MLSQKQIKNEVEKAGHKLVNADNYQNLSSFIEVECEKGHQYTSTVESLRKTTVCPECTKEIVNLKGYPPKKKGYRTVSIDQATNNAGIAVFDDGELVYVSQRSFFGELPERYVDFASFLVYEVINKWKPDELVFEDIQYQHNVMTFKVLGGLWGICIMLAETNKIPHTVISNKVWQSTFNIKGSTRYQQKQNTMNKVEELFGIKVNDDIADAILLGYHKVLQKGQVLF